GGCRRPSAAGRPGPGAADRRFRRAAAARARRARAPRGALRGPGALHRRPAAVGEGGAVDLEQAAGALRRTHPHAGRDPRRGSRGAACRRRVLARQGGLPALAGRARRVRRAGARRSAPASRRAGHEGADRGEGHRRVDRPHVPDVHPAPARRAAGRRPRRPQRRPRRLRTRSRSGPRRPHRDRRALAAAPDARVPLSVAQPRQRARAIRGRARL
ncbi:MAG: DNA-3-methyladenine glycosylase II, partial [uncultured Solirubrobacteraceae bacterium]